MKAYTASEQKIFRRLNSPKKIQDFLEELKINFEQAGETCMSPRFVIKSREAHCMEGAMFAAAALEFHGREPEVMDLRSVYHDDDHVVAVFRQFGRFGAISKTNHAVLRYREPVYKTIHELALSFFHEYFDDQGRKTLREYSRPFNLRRFDNVQWRTSEKDLLEIPEYLDNIGHFKILSSAQIKNLRRADRMEIKAGKLMEWKP